MLRLVAQMEATDMQDELRDVSKRTCSGHLHHPRQVVERKTGVVVVEDEIGYR